MKFKPNAPLDPSQVVDRRGEKGPTASQIAAEQLAKKARKDAARKAAINALLHYQQRKRPKSGGAHEAL